MVLGIDWAAEHIRANGPAQTRFRNMEELRAEVAALHARLEDDHIFRLGDDGEMIREDVEPGSIPDGIFCRDAAIAARDEDIDELRAELAETVGVMDDAIDGWEDCSNYKDAYLRKKHGDDERIAVARAILAKHAEPGK